MLGLEPGADSAEIAKQYRVKRYEHRSNDAMLAKVEAAHGSLMLSALNARMKVCPWAIGSSCVRRLRETPPLIVALQLCSLAAGERREQIRRLCGPRATVPLAAQVGTGCAVGSSLGGKALPDYRICAGGTAATHVGSGYQDGRWWYLAALPLPTHVPQPDPPHT